MNLRKWSLLTIKKKEKKMAVHVVCYNILLRVNGQDFGMQATVVLCKR